MPSIFDKLLKEHLNYKTDDDDENFEDYLNVTNTLNDANNGGLNWMAGWMKLNYANFSPEYDDFVTAVQESYGVKTANDETPDFKMLISFEKHGPYIKKEKVQMLNL